MKMTEIYRKTLCAALFTCVLTASAANNNTAETINIVPQPQSVENLEGTYKLNISKLEESIIYNEDWTLGDEAYTLRITKKGITIDASSASGRFYALQTLRQLIPAQKEGEKKAKYAVLPCCEIKDAPVFAYRGAHFDCCRHFFTAEEVKKYIDILAFHKINHLHWHLTDDQGWRIEIKAYPRLTEIGGWRKGTVIGKEWGKYDGIRYGGFYTQEQIKEVVEYAKERFITIVPEIEIPGHALAALTAYPELGCKGEGYEVSQTWGVFPQVFCPGKESTFKFWETVLTEVTELFPSKLIHIGGDECPKTEWKECPLCQKRIADEGLKDEAELQSYVTRRIEAFLNSKGRNIIGWDEILEGGVTKTATIMSWRGTKGGIAAAKSGNHVIMTPNDYCYLDYYATKDTQNEPLAIGGFVPLEKSYSFNPYESLELEMHKYIIGVQGNLWTEYITTFDHAQYMLLPRIAALAEVGWTYGKKDYQDFLQRMRHLTTYYDANGWNYGKHAFIK